MEGGAKRGAEGEGSNEGRETRKKVKVDYNEEKVVAAAAAAAKKEVKEVSLAHSILSSFFTSHYMENLRRRFVLMICILCWYVKK